jgi:hypothetical protein
MVAGFGVCLVPTVLGTLWLLVMMDEPRQIVLGERTSRLPAWLLRVREKRG